MKNKIKIIIADDHLIVIEGLKRILEECEDMEVIAHALNGKEAVRLTEEKRPDILILDITMPEYDGLEVINILKQTAPEVAVLVLTMHEEEQYIFRTIEAGAMGYLTKKSVADELVTAIRKVHSGKRYLPPDVAEIVAVRLSKGNASSPLDLLSTRELQVLKRIAQGETNKEIAQAYNLSVKTIDTYRQRILKKLNLRNNADISRFAIQHHLI